ncbi:hypothetical protein [uncultured Desulfovibrio sp.]|uniref:hypothetical protein n=1 Tax=uncultured Desulfovibrio sp. TaxID=167968 RepID=UPI002629437B|nr:hypothetical protein [uncultured Desulfovibrio sp.]
MNDFSLIQWREYATPDTEEPETRTVYVLSAKAIGRVAGAGTVYVCAPLPALGKYRRLPPRKKNPKQTGLTPAKNHQ